MYDANLCAQWLLAPSLLPGWGAQIDWAYLKKRTIAEY